VAVDPALLSLFEMRQREEEKKEVAQRDFLAGIASVDLEILAWLEVQEEDSLAVVESETFQPS
jgi:hypothetical protein